MPRIRGLNYESSESSESSESDGLSHDTSSDEDATPGGARLRHRTKRHKRALVLPTTAQHGKLINLLFHY